MLQFKNFIMHSGEPTYWKIECDELNDETIAVFAALIARQFKFSKVVGVPRGGLRIASALEQYSSPEGPVLIVDDVLTTGASMEEMYRKINEESPTEVIIGVVLFARAKVSQWWIHPVLQFWEEK